MSGSVSFTTPLAAYRLAQTNGGDTMRAIAMRELGDASLWVQLVALNGLKPPYIADSLAAAGPNVLLAGSSKVKVPTATPAPAAIIDPESIFGTDVLLLNGDLTADINGDIAAVDGLDNLVQALEDRFGTHPGDLLMHPAYGCRVYELIGKGASSSIALLAASYVSSSLQADPRVSSVKNAVASVAGDVVATTASVVTASGKIVPVGINGATPFPAAVPSSES